MNFRQWVADVRAFSTALYQLPGELEGEPELEIAPPLSEAEVSALAARWPLGLPDSLRRFWTEGASAINCRYGWSPPVEEDALVEEIFEGIDLLTGGVRFEHAEKVYPGNVRLNPEYEWFANAAKTRGAEGMALWNRCAAFLHVGNGDWLALDPEENSDDPAVVYLQHDEADSSRISPSFTEFLRVWRELCYIGPECWLLDYWLDWETKTLDPARHKTAELRALLTPRAVRVQGISDTNKYA